MISASDEADSMIDHRDDKGKKLLVSSTIRTIFGPHAKIFRLEDFILEYAPSLNFSLQIQSTPGRSHANILGHISKTLVVPSDDLKPMPLIRKNATQESLSTLVDDVIWSLVNYRKDEPNVLSKGYVVASEFLHQEGVQPCPNMRAGVMCTRLNGNVSFCKNSRFFRTLQALVGDELIRILLKHTSVLVPLEDDSASEARGGKQETRQANYMLVCGPLPRPRKGLLPACASDMKYERIESNQNLKKNKRKRKRDSTGSEKAESSGPSKQEVLKPYATISRRSLFYSNAFIPKVGLPQKHIMNDTNPGQGELLLGHMIPLSSSTNGRKRRKRWKRLRASGVAMCEDILARHAKCDYHRLLERHCPLPAFVKTPKHGTEKNKGTENDLALSPSKIASEVALPEVSSAHTAADHVVAFLSSVLRAVFPPTFWGSSLNFNRILTVVDIFVKLRRTEDLPNRTLLSGVRVTEVAWLFGEGHRSSNHRRKLSRSDHEAASTLVTHVLRWVFGQFIIPLLRSVFYITESEFSGKKVLFYRKPVWSLFRSLSMKCLLKKQYDEISKEEAKARVMNQRMGCSKLHLLPKATGVRPIAMLCERDNSIFKKAESGDGESNSGSEESPGHSEQYVTASVRKRRKLNENDYRPCTTDSSEFVTDGKIRWSDKYKSTNDILGDSFAALKYEYEKNKDLFGAGLLGLQEFYPRFCQFVSTLREQRSNSASEENIDYTNLYFASVDIRHCYDNINQEKLLDIVQKNLSEDDYMIHRYSLLHSSQSTDRVMKKKRSKVGPPETFNAFYRRAAGLNGQTHGAVFLDEAASSLANKEKILSLLREHLQSNIMITNGRHGNRFLLQKKGIPQGSVLSSFLCNFYYGDVERNLLSPHLFKKSLNGSSQESVHKAAAEHLHLLVRIIDDFLLITTDRAMHRAFLQIMHRGEASLGVQVNQDKIYSNIEVEISHEDGTAYTIHDTTSGGKFPWCGMLFDTSSCEVKIDYSRFANGNAANGLSVARTEREGEQLRLRMKTFVRPRCVPILFDGSINSPSTVATNFFEMMLLCAVKTMEYLVSSDMVGRLVKNVGFLFSCIDDLIFFAFQRVLDTLRQERHTVFSSSKMKLELRKDMAFDIGWTAFQIAFRELRALKDLLPCIDKRLKGKSLSPRLRGMTLQGTQLVKELLKH
jgi:hypothetical protein